MLRSESMSLKGSNMNHYVIRLNVQPCEQQFMWRVWENGQPLSRYASQVYIDVPSFTETTIDKDPDRFGRHERNNIACNGHAVWKGSVLRIVGVPE